jgi:hypothetical protein
MGRQINHVEIMLDQEFVKRSIAVIALIFIKLESFQI